MPLIRRGNLDINYNFNNLNSIIMKNNPNKVKGEFNRELKDFSHSVRYEHNKGERPAYYVTVDKPYTFDDERAEKLNNAFEKVSKKYDIDRDEINGDTFRFLDYNEG